MSCKELVELVTEYLEGTLEAPSRLRFDEHLEACPGCTDYLEQMRLTLRITGKLAEQTIEPAVCDELLRVFRDWKDS